MTRFLKRIGVFSILGLCLMVASQSFYSRTLMRNSIVSRIDRGFWASDRPYAVLVIGDSHLERGVDMSVFPDAYNLSFPGENYVQSYFKLRHVLEHWAYADRIDQIVVPVALHSFSSFRASRLFPPGQQTVWGRYIDPLEYLGSAPSPAEFLRDYTSARLFAYSGRFGLVLQWVRSGFEPPGGETPLVRGFVPQSNVFGDLTVGAQDSVGIERARFHFDGHQLFDPVLMQYFDKLVDLCTDHGIDLLLLTTPVTRSYLSAAVDEFGVVPGRIAAVGDSAQQREGVSYENYLDLYLDAPALFSDADHLNREGAVVFSSLLKSEKVITTE